MITTRVVSNLLNEHPFGWIIVGYFLAAAIGSGLMIFTMVVHLFRLSKFDRLARITAFLTPVFAGLMGLTLILELAQPTRFWRVMFNFNPTSPISWGAWILNLFGLLAVLYAYAEWKGITSWKRPLAVAGVPAAILLPMYTSFELLMTRSSPLWTSALLPVMYLLSAVLAGTAVVILISALTRPNSTAEVSFTLGRVGSHLLVYGLALVIVQVLVLLSRSPQAVAIGKNLVAGAYSGSFWGLVVGGGTLVPIALLYLPATGKTRAGQIVASLLILVGLFSQRALEIFAGMDFPQ
ncbi:MAG TPA: NrfD/PsrC family molybdoenzyme membrane anchor subunit [Symbiobacteriaceae bacterium]|nr:NrfD/PsrC family molybdoenzyme membrane anchor subunit [Symbiobacteriaceae bacterium]